MLVWIAVLLAVTIGMVGVILYLLWLEYMGRGHCVGGGPEGGDEFGNKMGQVHFPAQEIKKTQTRRVKESEEEKMEQIQKKKEKAESDSLNTIEQVFGGEDV